MSELIFTNDRILLIHGLILSFSFIIIIFVVYFVKLSPDNKTVADIFLGSLAANYTTLIQYYFGSCYDKNKKEN